jgi:ribosomal protein L11 methyltransferase
MLELFPEGFEEIDRVDGVELVAYTDASGEERLWHAFGSAEAREVADGWEDQWRTFHRPVRVGRLWVGPPWETPDADAIAIVVDPGRAFGTGAHPTTRLCLELLEGLPRSSVLDVGCGSGVLSIAAAKLGFGPILAVDVEYAAVEAARANAAANGVEIEVSQLDALTLPLPRADLVVANIALAAVERIPTHHEAVRFVTSGYLQSDEPVLDGWTSVERRRSDGWAADLFERPR